MPFNTTACPLQLPLTFISDLDKKFRRRITSADDLCMLGLSTLSTKSKQLKGLREVQNTAVRHYINMEEDILNINELLQLQHKYNSCGAYVVESHQ